MGRRVLGFRDSSNGAKVAFFGSAADVVDKRDLKPKPFTLDCNYSNLLFCRFSVETLSGDPTKQHVLVGLGYALEFSGSP